MSAIKTPWDYGAGTSEHSQQVALFMWAARAEHYGFDIANDLNYWQFNKSGLDMLSDRKPVPALHWLHAIPNGGMRSKATASNLVAEGVKKGVYDIFWPVTCKMFAGLYIEMKKPGTITAKRDSRTPEQKAFGTFLDEMGYAHVYCDNWEPAAWRIQSHWFLR